MSRVHGRWGRLLTIGVVVCGALFLSSSSRVSAYEGITSNPVALPGFDPLPDPAAVNSQIYATGGTYMNVNRNVQTENWAPGTTNVGNLGDALPTRPPGSTVGGIWAPSVAYIQGQYVMWVVTNQTSGLGAHLSSATSSSPAGPFTYSGTDVVWGANINYGILDPDLWQDPHTGVWWLMWAVENGTNSTPNKIYSSRLTSNGLSLSGSLYVLATYSFINSAVYSPYLRGGNPQIENASLVTDPRGTQRYNLTMSFGTYNATNAYRTLSISCDSPAGPCGINTPYMNGFDASVRGSSGVSNAGGASFVRSSAEHAEGFMMFAGVPAGADVYSRRGYFNKTSRGLMRADESIYGGGPDSGVDYCLCIPNGWELRMQSDGNLVIYNAANQYQWAAGLSAGNAQAIMQGDGNFVVYDNAGAHGISNTAGNPGAYLSFQNSDGNLVVYSATGAPLWATGT